MHGFDEVLRAGQLGEAWAFRALHDAYVRRVHAYLRERGAEDPEDLTNEVLASAFLALRRFEGDESDFRGWLFTIAHRRLVDSYRRVPKIPEQVTYDRVIDLRDEPSAESVVLDRLGEVRVHDLLSQLAPDQRDVLLLRLLADMTMEQISETLGKRLGAVKALQRRGLLSLVRLLENEAAAVG